MAELPTGTVTFLLTDVEGSTALWEEAAETMRVALARHDALFEEVVQEHRGAHIRPRGEGDSRFAVFASALDAVLAAIATQRALAAEDWTTPRPIKVRIGIHTGEADIRGDDYYGPAANRCARIRGLGQGGQILLSGTTAALVRDALPSGATLLDAGEHHLRNVPRPERIFQLVAPGALGEAPPLRAFGQRPNNLPVQPTSFIGRESELAEAADLLARARLVTLTGPGGTGKTRFALHVAADAQDRYPDGVFFVGLAPVFDPDLVIGTISQALGVPDTRGRPPIESLKDFLRERRLLLVLDNFEQVLAAGPHLTELLTACQAITLLVTSRVALRVSGEHELQVAPLALPDPDRQALPASLLPAVGRSEAVRLFVERARAVVSGFDLTEQNVVVVAEVCRRLDGLPLAIELAAARVRLLPPELMLTRLPGRSERDSIGAGPGEPATVGRQRSPLQFLIGGARDLPARQQTLRNTIAWSYDLLTPSEQALFRRLAIFVGGCTLDAVEAVGAADVGDRRWALAPDEILDGVESLIAKSLLRRLDGPPFGARPGAAVEPRFTMLETIREYGLEQLSEAGEFLTLRRWHAVHFLALAEQCEPGLRGHEQAACLNLLEAEHDNLRAAVEWGLADTADDQVALRLAGALSTFWMCRGHVTEGRRWLDRVLAREDGPPAARLKAYYGAGRLAHFQRDSPVALRQLEEALRLAQDLGDTWGLSWTLHLMGRVAYFDGDAETARHLGEQSLAAGREVGDDWLVGWALHLLALAAHIAGDYPHARALYEESIAVRQPLGYLEGIGICWSLLALLTYSEGDYHAARGFVRESLGALPEVALYPIPTVLATATSIAARLGQPRRAARLAGATAAFSESVDIVPIPLAEPILSEGQEMARRALGEAEYDAAWAEGRALSLDGAIDEGLADDVPPDELPARTDVHRLGEAPASLTEREAAVLRLIAAGRTTKEIAAELFVSVPTVERHITHLYGKIVARGRADATAYALQHGLAE